MADPAPLALVLHLACAGVPGAGGKFASFWGFGVAPLGAHTGVLGLFSPNVPRVVYYVSHCGFVNAHGTTTVFLLLKWSEWLSA